MNVQFLAIGLTYLGLCTGVTLQAQSLPLALPLESPTYQQPFSDTPETSQSWYQRYNLEHFAHQCICYVHNQTLYALVSDMEGPLGPFYTTRMQEARAPEPLDIRAYEGEVIIVAWQEQAPFWGAYVQEVVDPLTALLLLKIYAPLPDSE